MAELKALSESIGSKACRESYWDELTPEGRDERLRQRVKALEHQVERLDELVHRLVNHLHAVDGSAVMRVGLDPVQARPRYEDKRF